ncbi:2-hydroxyacid dehydrogenase [Daejeonella sp.]|uniref:2-hydroxyacid dehydrogenase n=1 Tax=Daejeonella sp. TaxID=2805397 RepID=UPI00271647F2|nr:2-hydroxyacid dehydrogenase [Daejeonella sp.]MDO8992831.1 2-hydroxyacid dehydrogenase [Daejeonella sp.]MDP2415844.1 2-hydroxyacid dehydrogenase [Daejeonella sp.]
MHLIVYSVSSFEIEYLESANSMKHEIILKSQPLGLESAGLAKGAEAVIIFTSDDASEPVINALADMGVKYILTRSSGTDHIDLKAAEKRGIKVANVPSYSPQAIAEQAVMLALALSRKLIDTSRLVQDYNFTIEKHVGFNFFGKTVGLIGLGSIGKATAAIFKGLGCRVIAFDINEKMVMDAIERVSLEILLEQSDIISLHAPLNESTRYLINQETMSQMKDGVMLLNTSRGALIKSEDLLAKLENGKIGYLGLDVYEFEKGLFFEDHSDDIDKDKLLQKLINHKNVIITPHQGFLTREALQEIAQITMNNINAWEKEFGQTS